MLEEYGEKIIGFLFAMWLAAVTFFGRRELSRIDGKADKSELAELMKKLDTHLQDDKELRHEITERLDRVAEATTQAAVSVARIEGQLANRQ